MQRENQAESIFPGFVICRNGSRHTIRCDKAKCPFPIRILLSVVPALLLLPVLLFSLIGWTLLTLIIVLVVQAWIGFRATAATFQIEPASFNIRGKTIARYMITGLYLKIPDERVLIALPQTAYGDFSIDPKHDLDEVTAADSDENNSGRNLFRALRRLAPAGLKARLNAIDHEVGIIVDGKMIPLASPLSIDHSCMLFHEIIGLTQSRAFAGHKDFG